MALKKGNIVQAKTGSAAYTTTTAKVLFTIPADAMIIGARANGTASNAATTGVLTFSAKNMRTGVAATFAICDVKTATAGVNATGVLSGIALARQSDAYQILATYTETGTAATAGAWTCIVDYL